MNLFQLGKHTLHSGNRSGFKIECDALTDDDWKALARIVANEFKFSVVIGIPTGGIKFAEALQCHVSGDPDDPWLLVDDVLTTGGSMVEALNNLEPDGKEVIGVVAFARHRPPSWIHPVFQLRPLDF